MNRLSALSLLLAASVTAASNASITGVSGTTTWLGVNPPNAQAFNLTGPNAYAWDEQQGVNSSALLVNIVANGTYTGPSPFTAVTSGSFDSHMIHFDPAGIPSLALGSVTFSGNILAVIFDEKYLTASDGLLGSITTIYDTGNFFRSYNSNILNASTLTVTGNTLGFAFVPLAGANRMFEVRVLTQVPVPGTISIAGFACLAVMRRARR